VARDPAAAISRKNRRYWSLGAAFRALALDVAIRQEHFFTGSKDCSTVFVPRKPLLLSRQKIADESLAGFSSNAWCGQVVEAEGRNRWCPRPCGPRPPSPTSILGSTPSGPPAIVKHDWARPNAGRRRRRSFPPLCPPAAAWNLTQNVGLSTYLSRMVPRMWKRHLA